MSLWKIAWRSMQQRSLASTLTGLSMALGVALVVTVLVIHGVIDRQFRGNAEGYHLIVGAKGGKLQLVLNTVFHLSQPIENIPYSFYEEFVDGKFSEQTKIAVPYCLGDSYRAGGQTFRVVGTTPDMFDKLIYGRHEDGTDKRYEFSAGKNFAADNFFHAVIGSVVARQSGLKVGDQFNPTHDIRDDDEGHKHDAFTIVGILAPTGTANDRALFVNIEGFLLLDGHAKEPSVEDRSDVDHGSTVEGDEHPHDSDHEAGEADSEAHEEHDEEGHEHAEEAQASAEHHEHTDDDHGVPDHAEESHAADHDNDDHDNDEAEHDEDGHDESDPDDHGHEEHAAEENGHDEHDHSAHAHTPLPKSQREVTAILVLLEGDYFFTSVHNTVNEGQVAQAVAPTAEVAQLLETMVAPIQWILLVLTVMIVAVASISILVGIYNSMSERSHDIAVMRALGASRSAVMTVILLESILLALCGGAAGILLGHGLVALANPFVVAYTGVEMSFTKFDFWEIVLIPALIILATIVGLLPALAAYRTDVAKSLSGSP